MSKARRVLAQRELARRRLIRFTTLTYPTYQVGWVHNDISARLEKFSQDVVQEKSPRLMLLMPPRSGKQIGDDVPIFTPDEGWKPHGELVPGDRVFHPHGRITTVTAVSEPAPQDCVVEFGAKTGSVGEVACHENHEWLVYDRSNGNWRTLETRFMEEEGLLHRVSDHKRWRFILPASRWDESKHRLSIRNIRREEPVTGRCIQVEAPDGLYLVGEGHWTTHNSELASIRFPAWHLGNHSTHSVVNVGYNMDLPMGFSRRVRETIRSDEYRALYPDTELDPHSQSVESWRTTSGGGYKAVGQGGGLTGHGANILIVDDPLKGMEDADNPTQREKLWEWFQSVAYTRLAPGGGVLCIECMTGDTPVMMADGEDQRLDAVRAGDEIATYRDGELSVSTVAGWKESGRDHVYAITTSSGRIVRANGRHPFLVQNSDGELGWVRTRNLTTASTIVAVGSTSDFTTERVVSVEYDGCEDVYDLQVDETENFIANGLVSHNTFWNDDDLAGRLLDAGRNNPDADVYEVVKYPAISEAWEYRSKSTNEILRFDEQPDNDDDDLELLRPPGEALHTDRYSTEAMKRIQANLYPRIWSALYQQNPVPDEGMYFKREYFKFQKVLPPTSGTRLYTAWDFAIGEKQTSDWNVGTTMMQDAHDVLYVMNVMRFQGDVYEIVEAILNTAEYYMGFRNTDYAVGVEDGQIWRAVKAVLKKRMDERGLYPSIDELRPMSDKLARARPLQGRMQQHRIVFPEEASWLGQARHEMLRFPAGTNDDVVDSMAWAVQGCLNRPPPKQQDHGRIPSWKDKLMVSSTQGSHMVS